MIGGVVGHQSLVYRRFQRMVEGVVYAADGGGGEATVLPWMGMHSALAF